MISQNLFKLNKLSEAAYQNSLEKGFWEDIDISKKVSLIIEEIGELIKAHRMGRYARSYSGSLLPKYRCDSSGVPIEVDGRKVLTTEEEHLDRWKYMYESWLKDTVEGELADIYIRCLTLFCRFRTNRVSHEGCVDFWSDTLKKSSFNEYVIVMSQHISSVSTTYTIMNMMVATETLYKALDSKTESFEWLINEVMKYNKTRERLHGKLYG